MTIRQSPTTQMIMNNDSSMRRHLLSSRFVALITISIILFLFVSPCSLHALHVHLPHDRPVCFYEMLDAPTHISVTYKLTEENSKRAARSIEGTTALYAYIKNPHEGVIFDQHLEAMEGEFDTRTDGATIGFYEICIEKSNSGGFLGGLTSKAQGTQKLHVDIHTDRSVGQNNDQKQFESKERLSNIEQKLKEMDEIIADISYDQVSFEKREKRFRVTSESMLHRMFVYGILQLLLLIGLAIWQVSHLRGFFIQRKLK